MVNAFKAFETLKNSNWATNEIGNGENHEISFEVPDGSLKTKVTLAWIDYPATVASIPALVNDLDLTVTAPSGTDYYPLVLDPAYPENPAVAGVDNLNNIEQVVIDTPVPGMYTININGTFVPMPNAKYAVSYESIDDNVNITYPTGNENVFYDMESSSNFIIFRWDAINTGSEFTLEITLDNGASWETLSTVPSNQFYYVWEPSVEISTSQANFRISRDGETYESGLFSINTRPTLSASSKDGGVTLTIDFEETYDEFKIYQVVDGEWTHVGTSTSNTHDIDGLTNGETYIYSATAVLPGGEETPRSNGVKVIPPNYPPKDVNLTTYSFAEEAAAYTEIVGDNTYEYEGDDWLLSTTFPIDFIYNGIAVNRMHICSNGWISLNPVEMNLPGYNNNLLYSHNYIAPYWDDLYSSSVVDSKIDLNTEGSSPNRVLIIQYKNFFKNFNLFPLVNFQVRFIEATSQIEFYYGDIASSSATYSASIGITGPDGGDNNFISIEPGTTSTPSDVSSFNEINYEMMLNLSNSKKYIFSPNEMEIAMPELIAPNHEEIISSADFSWSNIPAADSYRIQIAFKGDFTSPTVDSYVDESELMLPDLAKGPYSWRVKALTADDSSNWTSSRDFLLYEDIYTIGSGTEYNDEFSYPAPYGQYYFGAKHQILVKKSELDDAEIPAGPISALGFEVQAINGCAPLEDFTIKFKHVTFDEVSTLLPTYDFEFASSESSYAPSLGWNIHNFDVPFEWNGVDNLLIEVCFNNDSYTQNASTYGENLDFTSTAHYAQDANPNFCTDPGGVLTSQFRPNLKIVTGVLELDPPSLLTPADSATGVALLTSFTWSEVGLANSYIIEVATDVAFADIVVEEEVTTNSHTLSTELSEETLYYWRVKSKDLTESSDWSEVWEFTTVGASTPVVAPNLLSPADGSLDVPLTLDLSWEEIGYADGYNVQVSDDDFATTVFEENEITSSHASITTGILEPTKTYKWRVNMIKDSETSDWSDVWEFTTNVEIPPSWGYIGSTGQNSIIQVPTSITPMIGDTPIEDGDVIGVFYDKDGLLYCAGFGSWNSSVSAIPIVVWGDNIITPEKDGFDDDETYTFKIFKPAESMEYIATATYASGFDYYTENGYSVLASLYADTDETLTIPLYTGWNLISSNILVDDLNVESIFEPLSESILVKNEDGRVYDKSLEINNIGNWDMKEAYWVRVPSNDSLILEGEIVNPNDYPIDLPEGWNLIAYLRNSPSTPAEALSSIDGSYYAVFNSNYDIYRPGASSNTLSIMEPGVGYRIYMNTGGVLDYPEKTYYTNPINSILVEQPEKLVPKYENTGTAMIVIFESDNSIPNGYEVGVMTKEDQLLIGSGVLIKNEANIKVWGDNESTIIIDGALPDEELVMIFYDSKHDEIVSIDIKSVINDISKKNLNNLTFTPDNFIRVSGERPPASVEFTPDKSDFLSINLTPNPVQVDTKINIETQKAGILNITVYDQSGKEIAVLSNSYHSEGSYSFDYSVEDIASGQYYISATIDGEKVTTIMVVKK